MGKKALLGVLGAFLFSYSLFVIASLMGALEGQPHSLALVSFAIAFAVVLAFCANLHGIFWCSISIGLFFFLCLLGRVGMREVDLLVIFAFALAPFYYYALEGRGWGDAAKLAGLACRREDAAGIAAWCVFGTAGLFAIAFFVSFALFLAGISDQQSVYGKVKEFSSLMLLSAVALSPLAEEIFFRGFLRREIGALVSSAIFASLHFFYASVAEIVAAFFLGMWLCVVAERSRGVLAPAVAHSLFNLATIIYVVHFL